MGPDGAPERKVLCARLCSGLNGGIEDSCIPPMGGETEEFLLSHLCREDGLPAAGSTRLNDITCIRPEVFEHDPLYPPHVKSHGGAFSHNARRWHCKRPSAMARPK